VLPHKINDDSNKQQQSLIPLGEAGYINPQNSQLKKQSKEKLFWNGK